MYVKRNTEAPSCNHCCSGKATSITYCECVCGAYPACNAHAPYFHLWPAPLYNIFPYYLINGTIFGKKKMLLFDLLYNFGLKNFSF